MAKIVLKQGNRNAISFFLSRPTARSNHIKSVRCLLSSKENVQEFLLEGHRLDADDCNVPLHIAQRVGRSGLHRRPLHPLGILHQHILDYFRNDNFALHDHLSPLVSTEQNFDLLGIPVDHVSRSPSDTYYLNKDTVLRTHTSAHQVELLRAGKNRFLVAGDVYRRDEIDRSHYPIFHQMEGVKIFTADDYAVVGSFGLSKQRQVENDLKTSLEGLALHLFGPNTEMRWVDAYFPFTHPSMELEIYYDNEWLEVLGCGVVHPKVLKNAGRHAEEGGWAFGLGLERLAMVLFQIPDIRLFWTDDERFHRQFKAGAIVPFSPYSKFPACYKDISFWINSLDGIRFHVNDLNELVRDIAGDLVEQISLVDEFTHPKTGRTSHCYRMSYRSMDRSLTNEEIDAMQERVRRRTASELGVELR
jgi:phenylalanyl-tRNA synthetase alpha chain